MISINKLIQLIIPYNLYESIPYNLYEKQTHIIL